METPSNPNIGAAREAKERVLALDIAAICGIGIGRNAENTGYNIRVSSADSLQPDTAAQVLTAALPVDVIFGVTGPIQAQ